MPVWILVAIGGALGALARYALGGWITDRMGLWVPGGVLQAPVGTLVINVVGSFLLGAIATLAVTRSGVMTHELRLFAAVGFCGAFTTFSTFSLETLTLIQRGHWGEALVYVGASNLLALGAVAAGYYVCRWI